MDYALTGQPQRRPFKRKRSFASPLPWFIVVGVLALFGGDIQQPHKYYKSGNRLFSPISWTLTKTEAVGTRAPPITADESGNQGGSPVRVVWEVRNSKYTES